MKLAAEAEIQKFSIVSSWSSVKTRIIKARIHKIQELPTNNQENYQPKSEFQQTLIYDFLLLTDN
jgi:hypothetical protein